MSRGPVACEITTDKSRDTGPYLHVYVVKGFLPAKTRLYSLTLNKQLSYVLKFSLCRDGSFEHPKQMLKLIEKKIFTIIR